MNIQGRIHKIFNTTQVTDKFQKREFVILVEENPVYPQHISMQMVQEKVLELDSFNTGDMVDVHFNLKGREWRSPNGEIRYFNTLDAWKIDLIEENHKSTPTTADHVGQPELFTNDAGDDLPF